MFTGEIIYYNYMPEETWIMKFNVGRNKALGEGLCFLQELEVCPQSIPFIKAENK